MTLTDLQTSNISVIIPCRNEETVIAETIQSATREAFEIIVIDSGSDSSADIARKLGCQVFTTPPGRALQMNTGAQCSSGDILLFLHADTRLPTSYSTQVRTLLSRPDTVCGAFRLAINQQGTAFRIIETCTNIRAALFSMPYGDQALFLPKTEFESVAGYGEVAFLEDVLLIKALQKRGQIRLAKAEVSTSGRRWQQHGIVRTTLTNRLIMLGFLLGIPPKRLQHWYRIAKK